MKYTIIMHSILAVIIISGLSVAASAHIENSQIKEADGHMHLLDGWNMGSGFIGIGMVWMLLLWIIIVMVSVGIALFITGNIGAKKKRKRR